MATRLGDRDAAADAIGAQLVDGPAFSVLVYGGRTSCSMGRMGTPADVGNTVALLCSEQAGWPTGQVIYADGGGSLMDTAFPLEMQRG
jgi:NAD(P)-dependent dehydrogenase (short-subunit alcohol dehydrogenase family)